LAACSAALWLWAPSAEASYPGANGRIAFAGACTGSPCSKGLYSINPDGSGRVQLTGVPNVGDENPAWSPDGQKVAFERHTPASARESAIVVMNANGTGQTVLTPLDDRIGDIAPTWSPDGQRIAFSRETPGVCQEIDVMNADGSGLEQILAPGDISCNKDDLAWSPLGDKIAWEREGNSTPYRIYTMNPDGTGVTIVATTDVVPGGVDWSPAGDRLAFVAGSRIVTVYPTGGPSSFFDPFPTTERSPVWSPDGTRFAFDGISSIDDAGGDLRFVGADPAGFASDPGWQPLPPLPVQPGYPRPKGATPIDVSLVPAFTECTAPNRSHGGPLAFGSCAPPGQSSTSLTVGTPDANGVAANSVGRVRFDVVPGDPDTPADEADVLINPTLRDVRCRLAFAGVCEAGAMSDYTGGLQAFATVRRTDRQSGGSTVDRATSKDWPQLSVPMQCVATPDASGGSCGGQTSLETLLPGLVLEGRRAIWELDQISVRDGGIDDPRVDAFQTLAVQGLFVP
jgi:hypothetical protein